MGGAYGSDRAALLVELLSTKPRPLGRSHASSSSWLSHAAGRQPRPLLGPAGDRPARGPDPADTEQPCDPQAGGQLRTTSDLQGWSGAEDKPSREEGERLEDGAAPTDIAATARLSVVVEKHTLVSRLKVFEDVLHASGARGHHQDHADLEADPGTVQEEGEAEEKRMVWCVTGVCEAAGELSDSAHAGMNRKQLSGGQQEAANHSPSPPLPANEKPASPVPISRQPSPAPSHLSASRRRPASRSTNHRRAGGGGAETSCPVTEEKAGAAGARLSQRSGRKWAADGTSQPRPVRVLTQSEPQAMRRVLPLRTRPSSVDKQPEQGQPRSWGAEATLQRGQRPPSAPCSPHPGTRRSPPQQDSGPRPPSGKAGVRPRVQPEKICRSTLRALGGTASSSAPASPAHVAPPHTPLPRFATSTAASSFRRAALTPPSSSLRASSSPLSRAGSLRLAKSTAPQRAAGGGPQEPAAAPKVPRRDSSRPAWR